MKTKIITLTAILLMLAGGFVSCEKKTNCQCQELMNQPAMDCMERSFIEGLSIFLPENTEEYPWLSNYEKDGIFLIKGEVLETIEHGLKIRLIEDLKGSFPKNVNEFTVWGNGQISYFFISDNRSDFFAQDGWEKGDILLMLLTSINKEKVEAMLNMCCAEEFLSRWQWHERPGDFSTMVCTPSVVKLSDGSVTGRLLLVLDEENPHYVTEMPWEAFEKILQEILNSTQ